MDLGGEALGSFKAKQGGCTQIQVSRYLLRIAREQTWIYFQLLGAVLQRGIRKSQVSAFFEPRGMTHVEDRNRKMHQFRVRDGVLQDNSPRQCLHPDQRPTRLIHPTPRIRFLHSFEARPGVASVLRLWMDLTLYIRHKS